MWGDNPDFNRNAKSSFRSATDDGDCLGVDSFDDFSLLKRRIGMSIELSGVFDGEGSADGDVEAESADRGIGV